MVSLEAVSVVTDAAVILSVVILPGKSLWVVLAHPHHWNYQNYWKSLPVLWEAAI